MLIVSHISKKLISVSKFTQDNLVFIEFQSNYCLIKDKKLGVATLRETLEGELYKLDLPHLIQRVSILGASSFHQHLNLPYFA